MTKEPFILSLTQHGVRKSIELPYSEIAIERFTECIFDLIASSGYDEESFLRDLEEAARERINNKFSDKQ